MRGEGPITPSFKDERAWCPACSEEEEKRRGAHASQVPAQPCARESEEEREEAFS